MPETFSNVVISDGSKDIGDIVFLGSQWVMIRAYYDDRDADEDGTVSIGEKVVWKLSPFNSSGFQIARVAYTASLNRAVLNKDGEFLEVGRKMQLAFAADLVVRGYQATYLKGQAGKIASMFVTGFVKQWVVKKGAEKIVSEAVKALR